MDHAEQNDKGVASNLKAATSISVCTDKTLQTRIATKKTIKEYNISLQLIVT